MSDLMNSLGETVQFIQSRYANTPTVGIVLGSGLGNLVAEMKVEQEIPYTEIPHFPVSTVKGHSGKLIFGELAGKKVLVMAGRFHYYEGYSASEVTYPVRVMKMLGVGTLLISNAAGGMNPDFEVGDLMVIQDQISLFTVNPLIGKNADELGPRFPDMSEPFNKGLISKARTIAKELGINLHKGVYVGVTGPTFESRAEYKMLHILGADAVGMSTVQEVIVARHMGVNVFAISVITDLGIREEENTITHEEVLQAAREAEPKLTAILKQLVQVI
ncbi:purine-nucleoside phosphorylase [Flavihumibacter profundi]|jgi:purine-nucleoside phosphorylase|uniref:purine-nucleoside phosphorylase n=1 Tax=Flavihumibacter profundi TaxID=2716883 RepID=UPI001CC5FBE8|nr:purine-nucleoside phosphorylase [Flavihumibacter profundi]MBZ5856680.1 purine-nucleoside phosphorylase [Flavihumibacter profundi]